MNLSVEQIKAIKAGQPVVVDTVEAGKVYLLSEERYRQVLLLLQSETEQESFRGLAMDEADRIATENPY
jgi:hypothetical protein